MSKLKFVLSDLHLGAGYGEEGNALEDFTADRPLVHLLQQISQEGERDKREIELIINGDFFEFLQVPAVENYNPATIYPKEAYLDSSQQASVKRLNIIFDGHREVFKALSDFMRADSPKRRITIVKGNHDVHLYWPKVKSRLREMLDALGPRSSLLLYAAEFISREQIYIEHGHQRTERINCYPDFHDPRLSDDPFQLYYPPASTYMIDFLNYVERERWFVDSVKPVTILIWFALRWDFGFAAEMLASFIRHTTSDDNASNQSHHRDIHSLLQQLEDSGQRRQLAQRYANDDTYREQFHRQIQPYLVDRSGMNSVYADIDRDPVIMGHTAQAHQQLTLQQAAEEIARQEKAQVILFGHTHQPVYHKLTTDSVYINTGCWLGNQDLTDASPETWQALFQETPKPDILQPRLPYARIDYDEHDRPTAQLLDFANNNAALHHVANKSANFFTKLLNRFTTSSKDAA